MAGIILPHQLFPEPIDEEPRYLVEHPRFFTHREFHQQKLVLHRASMQWYKEKVDAGYLRFDEDVEELFEQEDRIRLYDPVDHRIRDRFTRLAEEHGVTLVFEESPMFLASASFNERFFRDRDYFQFNYYKAMRQRLDVLIADDGGPVGEQWSFDPENRQPMPPEVDPPPIPRFRSDYVDDAKQYVQDHFGDNPGNLAEFIWPVTREQALENLADFLANRLHAFGDYQDAFDADIRFGFHSLLSASLNIGLLTPHEVVDRTLDAHAENDYPLNALEGFLRQIIGWREFVRALYDLEPGMRESNVFDNTRSLPETFYTGTTNLPPVDDAISNAREYAYCHHIERLMVLGNIMLLLEIDPDDVYNWFMELFIDAYDWVMVPNIYGMGQYSDGGLIMTKPYISSSNYINKMSHYQGGDWEDAWDGLYWRFIHKHREAIENIPRMAVMPSHLDGMSDETLQDHLQEAADYLDALYT